MSFFNSNLDELTMRNLAAVVVLLWRKVGEILLAWVSTVPCGAVLAAIAYGIVSRLFC